MEKLRSNKIEWQKCQRPSYHDDVGTCMYYNMCWCKIYEGKAFKKKNSTLLLNLIPKKQDEQFAR